MMIRLQELCELPGVSGREEFVRESILNQLKRSPAEMRIQVDAMGNVIAYVTGKKRSPIRLLFAAHMDEVGFLVTGATEEGWLRFTPVGGMDSRVVFGKRVLVNGHPGVIGGKATHQCTGEEKQKVPDMDRMLIDVGAACREEALAIVQPGDPVVFDSGFLRLENGFFKARALDDRAGCALLLGLVDETPEFDMVLAFTVQEEVGLRGAETAAFSVEPDMAVVVDATTAADTMGIPEERQVCHIGGGPVVSFMDSRTLYDRALYTEIRRMAEENGIPTQTKTMVAGGNDAGAIHRSRGGVRTAAVSLPCRYIHSPACVLQERDLEETAALLRLLARELPCKGNDQSAADGQ
ncbi:MAG: M42 family metallopeptidase [Clostridiales bacterium]|nr:M42 family metallopeptidase [Clostridiales bacterium]